MFSCRIFKFCSNWRRLLYCNLTAIFSLACWWLLCRNSLSDGRRRSTRGVSRSYCLIYGALLLSQVSFAHGPNDRPTGWPKEIGTIVLYALTLPNINGFSKLFYDRNQRKCVITLSLKIPPHLKYVATLMFNFAAERRTQASDATNQWSDQLNAAKICHTQWRNTWGVVR